MFKTFAFLSLFIAATATVLVATQPSAATKVAFSALDWEAAKSQAAKQKKLFFVDFDASYCPTCRNMEKTTFMDDNLAAYMSQNVLALNVNVQDFDGIEWSQQYNVEALPTMLIFDQQGNLVERFVGYKSAKDLLSAFERVQNASVAAALPLTQADKPLSLNTTSAEKKAKIAPAASLFGDNLMNEKPAVSLANLFEVAVKKQTAKGFSVQVGSYGSYEMVLEQAEQMKDLYNQKTIINIDKSAVPVQYKLLLGNFGSRNEAQQFLLKLKENKMDGLIRDLQTL